MYYDAKCITESINMAKQIELSYALNANAGNLNSPNFRDAQPILKYKAF